MCARPLDDLRVLVVGAGAIGGVTAAKLAVSGVEVAVVDADPHHVRRLREPGLVLDDLGAERRVVLDAHTDASELDGPFDFALVAVKSSDLQAALAPLVERGLVHSYVSLGNGLVQEQIGDLVGWDRLVVGITEWGATNLGAGRVARTTRAPFIVGEPDGAAGQRTQQLAALLETVDDVEVSENIWGHVWSKLLVNSTFSGLGTVGGMSYGEVVRRDLGREAVFGVWSEGFDVATKDGVRLEPILGIDPADLAVSSHRHEERARRALDAVMARVAATKASMLQDLERGRPTEVGIINGALVKKASQLGVRAPANQWITRTIHAMERGEVLPRSSLIDELVVATQSQA